MRITYHHPHISRYAHLHICTYPDIFTVAHLSLSLPSRSPSLFINMAPQSATPSHEVRVKGQILRERTCCRKTKAHACQVRLSGNCAKSIRIAVKYGADLNTNRTCMHVFQLSWAISSAPTGRHLSRSIEEDRPWRILSGGVKVFCSAKRTSEQLGEYLRYFLGVPSRIAKAFKTLYHTEFSMTS